MHAFDLLIPPVDFIGAINDIAALGCRTTLVLLLATAQILCARVAVVHTAGGDKFTGHVRFTRQGVLVVNSAQSLVIVVPATNVSSVSFVDETAQYVAEEPGLFGVLPGAWRENDIGAAKIAGSTRVEHGTFTVRGGGTTVDAEGDSFHYVYCPAHGDQDIVARVTSVQYTHPNAKAGLMMRETMSEYSRSVAVMVSAQRGGAFQARYFEGRAPQSSPQPDMRAPYWVKLRRRGQEFTGYKSRNGRQWTVVDQMHVPINENYYVGLAVTSASEGVLNWTTFDKVRLGPKLGHEDFTPQIELTSGSIVVGQPKEIDMDQVIFVGGPKIVPVSLTRIARIIYQPLSAELAWKTRVSPPGVWMLNGDFFEGSVLELRPDRIRVSSVLYGRRAFDVTDEVSALVLHRAGGGRASVEVNAVDGSILLGNSLSFADGEVILKEPALGEIHLPSFMLSEFSIR